MSKAKEPVLQIDEDSFLTPTYASRYMDECIPKHRLPSEDRKSVV